MNNATSMGTIITFFVIWVVLLVLVWFVTNKITKKPNAKIEKSSIKIPSNITPATNAQKTLFMRTFIPEGSDKNSQKAAEQKLQICQNLYVAKGKVTAVKTTSDGKRIENITIKTGDFSFKISDNLKVPVAVDDNVITFYEKGLSGICHYLSTVKLKESVRKPHELSNNESK